MFFLVSGSKQDLDIHAIPTRPAPRPTEKIVLSVRSHILTYETWDVRREFRARHLCSMTFHILHFTVSHLKICRQERLYREPGYSLRAHCVPMLFPSASIHRLPFAMIFRYVW